MTEPVVPTKSGAVRGRRAGDGSFAFLGIPYADAPVADRQFSAPGPVTPWDGVRDAGDYGPTAPQPRAGFTTIPEPVIPGDEFLNVNVFTPDPAAAGLPVLVWVHGGGFVSGCNASPWYRGERFARDGVVLVSIGYRLGALGFLAIDGAPANRAVLDWIAALRWVQDNIAGFGGDPSLVTVAGQSAGGAACATLLATGSARGLFHRAVLMSGAGQWCVPAGRARAFAHRFATELGVPPTATGFGGVALDRVLDVQQRLAGVGVSDGPVDPVAVAERFAGDVLLLAPVVDGELLPGRVDEQIAAGAGGDVDVLIGHTAEEFNAAAVTALATTDAAGLDAALPALGLSGASLEVYRSQGAKVGPALALAQAMTDRGFRAASVRTAEARAAVPARTYLYEFRWRSPALGGILGAGHCLDLPFVFDNLDAEGVAIVAGEQPPQELADRMHGAWVGFVQRGDPGWPPYEPTDRATMLFGDGDGQGDGQGGARVALGPLDELRTVWADTLARPEASPA